MKTVENQNHFDVAVQELGTIDNISEVLSRITNPNASIPAFTTISLPQTFDVVAKNRIFNSVNIATGVSAPSEVAVGIGDMYIESPIPVFTIS